MSTNAAEQACIYDVTVLFTLHNTDREVADEFVAARDIRKIDPSTIEVMIDVVAPDNRAAYHRGLTLVEAILDAAGLSGQYSTGSVTTEESQ